MAANTLAKDFPVKKAFLLLIVVLVLCLLGVYIFVIHKGLDLNKAHGTVDIQDSLLSFERSGKIINLYVDEGNEVHQGDLLARLDSQALEHQLRIQFAQCNAERSLLEQYQNGYLKEELDSAKANVAKAQAAVDLAAMTYKRNASLLESKSVSKQDYDSAKAAYDQAQAALAESEAQLALYQRGYREEMISAQAAKVSACTQQLRYLDYQINNQGIIRAPFTGTIRAKTHELSDFVGAGETIFTLTNELSKKIRIYLSENQLNLIKTGQTVSVEVPYHAPLAGKVTFISPAAMFTPKSVQTEDLRADLVYEVTVEVSDPNKVLRFGQAITVYLKGSAPDHQSENAARITAIPETNTAPVKTENAVATATTAPTTVESSTAANHTAAPPTATNHTAANATPAESAGTATNTKPATHSETVTGAKTINESKTLTGADNAVKTYSTESTNSTEHAAKTENTTQTTVTPAREPDNLPSAQQALAIS